VVRAVNESDNPIVSDLLTLLLYTGLRIKEEALKLEWDNVDMDAGPSPLRRKRRRASGRTSAICRAKSTRYSSVGWTTEKTAMCPGATGKDRLGYPARQMATITEKTGSNSALTTSGEPSLQSPTDTVPQSQLKYLLGHSTKGGDVTAGYIILSTEKKMDAEQKMADAIDRLLTPQPKGMLSR